MPKRGNNGCASKPEPNETYRCARKGGRVEGETTSTEVVLEDKGLAVRRSEGTVAKEA